MRKVKARVQGGGGSDSFSINVEDEKSGVFIMEIMLNKEQLASLLLVQSFVVDIELLERQHYDNIGKRCESKTEIVACKHDSIKPSIAKKRAAVEPFEVDGWKANLRDIGNHHKSCGDGKWRVSFSRYVDDE